MVSLFTWLLPTKSRFTCDSSYSLTHLYWLYLQCQEGLSPTHLKSLCLLSGSSPPTACHLSLGLLHYWVNPAPQIVSLYLLSPICSNCNKFAHEQIRLLLPCFETSKNFLLNLKLYPFSLLNWGCFEVGVSKAFSVQSEIVNNLGFATSVPVPL